jgi:hypothetical protein
MVESVYFFKPAWCGIHLAGLRPEQGLQPVTRATAFRRWFVTVLFAHALSGDDGGRYLAEAINVSTHGLLWGISILAKPISLLRSPVMAVADVLRVSLAEGIAIRSTTFRNSLALSGHEYFANTAQIAGSKCVPSFADIGSLRQLV